MPTLDECLKTVGTLALSRPDKSYGFLFPTQKEAHRACNKFWEMIQELPDWIRPNARKFTNSHVDLANGVNVKFASTVNATRGMTFDGLFVSSRLSDIQKTEFSFVVIPTMAHSPGAIVDFI